MEYNALAKIASEPTKVMKAASEAVLRTKYRKYVMEAQINGETPKSFAQYVAENQGS